MMSCRRSPLKKGQAAGPLPGICPAARQTWHRQEDTKVAEDSIVLNETEWVQRQARRRTTLPGAAGYTVEQWVAAVEAARCSAVRTMIVIHCFAGPRRTEDIQEWLEQFAEEMGFLPLMLCIEFCGFHTGVHSAFSVWTMNAKG